MRMKRSTGDSRIASRRIRVPSTFVSTNSRPPSAIDLATCDSAAAFTITSTSATTSAISSASQMSPRTNDSRSCDITSARFSRFPAYVSASSETTSWGVFARRWRMKLVAMNPAPPVTRTRLRTAGSLLNEREQIVVERGCRARDDRVRVDRPRPAVHVGDDRAGLGREQAAGRDVERRRPEEDVRGNPAGGDVRERQRRAQGSDVPPEGADGAGDRRGGTLTALGVGIGVAVLDDDRLALVAGGGPAPLVAAERPGAVPPLRDVELARRRIADDAEHHLLVLYERDV